VTLQVCFYYSDLYDLNLVRQRRDQLVCLGQSLGAASLLLGMVYFAVPELLIGRGVFFISTALVAAFALIARIALDAAWHVAAPKQRVLILGAEKTAMVVATELMRRGDLNVEVAGFLESTPSPAVERELLGHPVLGALGDLERIVAEGQISRLVVALEDRRGALPIRDLVRLRVSGVRVEDAHSALAALSGRIWLEMVTPSWFIFSDGFRRSRLTLILKRIIDLSFGLAGLVLSSPIMAVVALAVKLDSKGPALFRQTRVGYKGRLFEVLKFRSMRVDAEAGGAQWARKNDDRVTRLGKYLRKFRLDELPQFINVIRGDMSFVGPRPERPVFVDRLREVISYYDERHSVRPGLTGWAQVEYSYGASVEDAVRKAEYDLFYLKNMSLFFDCVIVLKTIRIILTGRGAH
jgi:sugar transferase (PEP-CTERM system associated)